MNSMDTQDSDYSDEKADSSVDSGQQCQGSDESNLSNVAEEEEPPWL